MEHSFHYLMMANHSVFQKGVFSSLKNSGLSIGQPKVLDFLKDADGASQKEIAGACHIEPASLTVILNGMEDKGLIERKNMHGNRRTSYVFLTEKGKESLKAVDAAFSAMEALAFQNISASEQAVFLQTFQKIYQNLTHTKEDITID